jgi:hypothetical protein
MRGDRTSCPLHWQLTDLELRKRSQWPEGCKRSKEHVYLLNNFFAQELNCELGGIRRTLGRRIEGVGGNMALYLVSYDIADKNHDYQSLLDELHDLKATRILYSEWAVPYSGTAGELVRLLQTHIEKGDKLLACELFNTSGIISWNKLRITSEAFKKILSDYARTLN